KKENKLFSFEFGKSIYLQLHKANLYSIFSSALIVPSKYITNRAFLDTQSVDENYLVLSNGIISDLDETQILLEINYQASEEKNLNIVNAIAFTQHPLPISRIKK